MGTFTDNPAKTKIPLRRSTMWLLAAAAFLALGATVLLWLCTFSVPHIMSLYYLKAKDHGQTVKFGTFGHCGSSRSCSDNINGYRNVLPLGSSLPGAPVVVTPISAGITTVTTIFLIYSLIRRRAAGFSLFMALMSTTLTVVSFILVLATFVGAHNRAKKHALHPTYGPAMWLHLVATLWMILVSLLAALAWFRHKRAVREANAIADATHLSAPQSHDAVYSNAAQSS